MYVKANHFDYDAFLEGIQNLGGLQDDILTQEILTGVLKRFADNYKKLSEASLNLGKERNELCQLLLSDAVFDYKVEQAADNVDEPRGSYHQISSNLDEQITDSIEWVEYALQNGHEPCDTDFAYKTTKYLYDRVIDNAKDELKLSYLIDSEIISEDEIIIRLKEWLESYLRSELSDLDKFIFDNISYNMKSAEVLNGISVIDIPGTIVKYGDTLITIPLILIEVLDG